MRFAAVRGTKWASVVQLQVCGKKSEEAPRPEQRHDTVQSVVSGWRKNGDTLKAEEVLQVMHGTHALAGREIDFLEGRSIGRTIPMLLYAWPPLLVPVNLSQVP